METPNRGVPNAEVPNTGVPYAGVPNTGVPYAGTPNTGAPYTGAPNAGAPNTGVPNTGVPYTGVPNAGVPNTGVPYAGAPNAGIPNAGIPNAGVPYAGTPNMVNPNMIFCKYCGYQVPKKTKKCPNCGKKLKKKTGCLISVIVAIIVIVLLLAMCSASPTTSTQAENVNFEAIYNDCADNIAAANNNYVGKTYQFAGRVKSIEANYITVVPKDFPVYYPLKNWYLVDISMSQDEIMKVKTGQVINVKGTISELDDTSVTMEDGAVIDDIIAFDGKVTGFTLNESRTKHLMKVEENVGPDLTITYYVEAGDTDKFENIDSAIFNGVTFTTGDTITATAQMNANGAYFDSYIVTAVESMEKTN